MEGWKEYLKYIVFFVVLAAIALGGLQVLKTTLKTRYPVMVVVSESMIPTLGVGDFIIVGQIQDFSEIVAEPAPIGDIFVYRRTGSSDEYIVHRAIEKELLDDEWQFVTKGDNNIGEDWPPIKESRVMGKVVGRVPVIGYFPLFIKTSLGFVLVALIMVLVFFADHIMPEKRLEKTGGRFPWLSVAPFVVTPIVFALFFTVTDTRLEYELIALAAWYLGCVIAPLAFDDDDMGLMFWLYHFVLTMLPLGCDIVWRLTGITPSEWWYVEGSTVPITWLLQRETPMFYEAFGRLVMLLLPGCAIFLLLIAAKRWGIQPMTNLSRRMRGSKENDY
ncbi:MAG: signal peptidase I [Candidatus Bathyarchaeota archaeon]|nr:MAG: signal peptidase I [Candidatus Bathyarchaeota archaeon]